MEDVRGVLDQTYLVWGADAQRAVDAMWADFNIKRFEEQWLSGHQASEHNMVCARTCLFWCRVSRQQSICLRSSTSAFYFCLTSAQDRQPQHVVQVVLLVDSPLVNRM